MTKKIIWTEDELPQGSGVWLAWRKAGVAGNGSLGGSDIATLMLADFNNHPPRSLYRRLKGLDPPKEYKTGMARGNRLEPMAREAYADRFEVDVHQLCAIHPEFDWMRTSLDGLTEDKRVILEIKCPTKLDNHKKFTKGGKVPAFRYPQMQWQLMVMKAVNRAMGWPEPDRVDYISFWVEEFGDHDTEEYEVISTDMKVIKVRPRLEYIDDLARRAEVFMGYMERNEEPPSTLFLEDEPLIFGEPRRTLPTNDVEDDE